MNNLGSSGTARVRPALSRGMAQVGAPGKIQAANASGKLPKEPLAIQVKPPKKKNSSAMFKGVATAMLNSK